MADPLSIAGTGVGIASLGIQVCQSLLDYYHDWKDYDQDIKLTTGAISDLEEKFALLREVLDDPKLSQHQKTKDSVNQSLVLCEEGS